MAPRSREFDVDDALEKAMHLFWEKGYADTSIRDLAEHIGVSHAGIYSAFGDKEGLFKASIEKYSREFLHVMFSPLEGADAGRKQIETLFSYAINGIREGIFRNGCFIANSAVEFAGVAGPITLFVQRSFKRQVKAFKNALNLAVKNGEVRPNLDVNRIACSLATTFNGVSVLARAGLPMSILEEAAAAAIEQLD